MTEEEMNDIISINKKGSDPAIFLSGGIPIGYSVQEKINAYWEILGKKYGFKPMTVEGSPNGRLFFYAEPEEKLQPEIEIEKYDTIAKIVAQLESCNYECEGGLLENNVAFIALKRMA